MRKVEAVQDRVLDVLKAVAAGQVGQRCSQQMWWPRFVFASSARGEVAAAGQVVLPACQLRSGICLPISMPRHTAALALMQESGASEAELAALKKRKLVAAESWKTYRVRLLKPSFAVHERSGC